MTYKATWKDAPMAYAHFEKEAWAAGYNDAVEALRAQPSEPQGHSPSCLSHHPLDTGEGNWHCDCGYDAREFDTAPAGNAGGECPCGESTCTESWEPGCGLGTRDEFAEVATPQQSVAVDGEMFICYLIDNCERETIHEESLHQWLADFLKNTRYHKPTPQPDEPVAVGGWPDYLMIRDTKLSDDIGGMGQRIFTTAGAGYVKQKYVRADLAAPVAQSREVESGEVCRYFASGPEGSFFTQSLADAQNLLDVACFDSDEWTVTDLLAPSQESA